MITVGASAYPRIIDFARMGEIAREVALIFGRHCPHCRVVWPESILAHRNAALHTTRIRPAGTRGGLVLCKEKYAKEIDSQTFPHSRRAVMHVIAAKAVCFHERRNRVSNYISSSCKNARALAEGMKRNTYRLVSGGTDNHLMLVDVGAKGVTGKDCQIALDEAGIR